MNEKPPAAREPGWNSMARLFQPPPRRKTVRWTIDISVAVDAPWEEVRDLVLIERDARVVSLQIVEAPLGTEEPFFDLDVTHPGGMSQ